MTSRMLISAWYMFFGGVSPHSRLECWPILAGHSPTVVFSW